MEDSKIAEGCEVFFEGMVGFDVVNIEGSVTDGEVDDIVEESLEDDDVFGCEVAGLSDKIFVGTDVGNLEVSRGLFCVGTKEGLLILMLCFVKEFLVRQ